MKARADYPTAPFFDVGAATAWFDEHHNSDIGFERHAWRCEKLLERRRCACEDAKVKHLVAIASEQIVLSDEERWTASARHFGDSTQENE